LVQNRRQPTTTSDTELSLTAEELWWRSEQYYQSLIENASDAICVLDSDGIIRYESISARNVLGYRPEERQGKSVYDLIHPDDLPNASRIFEDLIQNRVDTVTLELRLIHKDGSHRFIESIGQNLLNNPIIRGIVVNFHDITDRKKAEERYQILADNVADVIWAVDLNMRPTYISPSIKRLLGYSVEEAMTKNMEEVFTPASFETAMKTLSEELAVETMQNKDAARSRTLEIELIRKDGSVVPVEIKCSFLREPDGRPIEILVVARDTTERWQAEAEKQKAQLQLQVVNRLAAVGELTSSLSQELNNPLVAVKTFAGALAEMDNVNQMTKRYAEAILKEAGNIAKVLNNMASFSRKQKPEKHLISINEILEQSLELYASQMKMNNIEILKQLDQNLPKTMGDIHRIQLVFVNIISHIEQAMVGVPEHGDFSVMTHKVGNFIHVVFSSNGPGMAEDDLECIFDPLCSMMSVDEGPNFGLSISFGIVREHGGRIYAMSTHGEGETFVVELPVEPNHDPIAE